MTFTQEASFTRKWFSGRSCIRSNWKFRNVDIWGEGKTWEKASWSRAKKQHTTQPIYGHKYGIDPGSHQWEAEAITSVPSLLPINSVVLLVTYIVPKGAIWSRSRGSLTVHSFFVWNQTFVRFQWFFCLSSSHLQTKRRRALTSWAKS